MRRKKETFTASPLCTWSHLLSESQGSRVYKCSDTLLTAGGDPAKPPLIGPLGSDLSATCSSSIQCRHSGLGVYARWGSAVQERAGGYRGWWEREKPPSEHRKQHWVLKQWCWEFSFPLRGAPAARCHEATQAGSALRVEREEGC